MNNQAGKLREVIISNGYRPEATGYEIYSPRATHEGNKLL